MALPDIAPVVTARTLVREIEAGDLADLMAVNGDPEVTRFLPYATWQSSDDAQAWLARMQVLAAGGGARQLVIVHRADSRVIGTVLLFRHDEGSGRIELGYTLGRAHWRQGLAAEALRGLLDRVFGELGLRRVEAEVHVDNAASNALLGAIGFVHEGRLRERWVAKGHTYDVNAWGLLAREWPARRR